MSRAELRSQAEQFLHYLENEKRYSASTVDNYRRSLDKLQAHLKPLDITQWSEVSPKIIRQFIASQHRKGASPATLSGTLSAIRGFYRYRQRKHNEQHNPCQDIPLPKARRSLPKTLTPGTLDRLLGFTPTNAIETRDQAILELLYSSGLRRAELLALDADDIDFNVGTVQVTGKGRKQRLLPIGRKALNALLRWDRVRHQLANADERAFFVGQQGKRLSAATLAQRLKYWATRQGIEQNIHPHRLRHSFASHILESSQDLRAVQELLGHANISTTQIYTHLDFQHLAKVYDDAHPRARKSHPKPKKR